MNKLPSIRPACLQVQQAVQAQRGMLLLCGDYGTGKTRLLISAVNELRATKIAIFTTAERLLAYLRQGFDPDRAAAEPNFESRWQMLLTADLLAIDELEKYHQTAWASAKFQELLNDRWRHIEDRLTLAAMNGSWDFDLDPAIRDRFRDGRAKIIEVDGESYRPLNHWSDEL